MKPHQNKLARTLKWFSFSLFLGKSVPYKFKLYFETSYTNNNHDEWPIIDTFYSQRYILYGYNIDSFHPVIFIICYTFPRC